MRFAQQNHDDEAETVHHKAMVERQLTSNNRPQVF